MQKLAGIVLLKNLNDTLPIEVAAVAGVDTAKTMVILGPTIEIKSGGYSGRGTGGPFTVSTALAISEYANASAKVVPGCLDVSCMDNSGIAEAVAAASEVDVVIVAVGLSSDGDVLDRFEGENNDRR